MNKYTNPIILFMVVVSMYGTAEANIIATVTQSIAGGNYLNLNTESGDSPPQFNSPQISEAFGSKSIGSAGSFDSTSDIDGDSILFKNGNASYGANASSSSRTVVEIEFENTGINSVIPILKSQILPAGMGFYVSDCTAEDLRNCESRSESDFGFDDIKNYSGPDGLSMKSMFNFRVETGNATLFELTGSISLLQGELGSPSRIVTNFNGADTFLNDFRESSPIGSRQQSTFDWGATDFDVSFLEALLPGERASVKYITEVSTYTNSTCNEDGQVACPIAYAAFGDPIGRGGTSNPTASNRSLVATGLSSASFVASSEPLITGYEAGLYKMALPTFEDGILTYRALSGPGIAAAAVPGPSIFSMLLFGLAYLTLSRKRHLK